MQKPRPPFVIGGGGGEQLTLRVVAKYADIWNHGGAGVELFRHKVRSGEAMPRVGVTRAKSSFRCKRVSTMTIFPLRSPRSRR
ncbi:MAG: hypothetical protein R2848_00845 [Thermomicrobiales bacterium]